jgi:hypothetical protein
MSVYTKLMKARLMLQGKKLAKTGKNSFAGYQYFELGDFLPTVQEIFAEIGLCGVVSFKTDLATLQIVDTESNDSFTITSPMGSAALKGCHEVQNIGAVETYQRRYLWVSAMEIVEHDALDATTGKEPPAKAATRAPIITSTGNVQIAMERTSMVLDVAEAIKERFAADDLIGAYEVYLDITAEDEKVYLWKQLPSNIRSAIKKHGESLKETA